jgi:putative resolvase
VPSSLLSIETAAELLGVAVSTMRRWERERRLIPAERTAGGHRRYTVEQLRAYRHSDMTPEQIMLATLERIEAKLDLLLADRKIPIEPT